MGVRTFQVLDFSGRPPTAFFADAFSRLDFGKALDLALPDSVNALLFIGEFLLELHE